MHGEAGHTHDLGEGASPSILNCTLTHKPCREMLLHKSLHTGRGLYSEMVLHRGMILQRDASTRKCSHTEMLSTQRYFYTHRCFRTQIPLHRDRWAKRNFLMQARLHKGAFTQRCVYTQVFLHTNTCTQCFCILLRKHTLTHTHSDKCFHTHTFTR